MTDENKIPPGLKRALEDRLVMIGTCACGGTLVRHPWRRMVWVCSRSHFWNRRKHVYLVGESSIEVRKP